jgi:hypothetical protein
MHGFEGLQYSSSGYAALCSGTMRYGRQNTRIRRHLVYVMRLEWISGLEEGRTRNNLRESLYSCLQEAAAPLMLFCGVSL